MNKGKVDEFIIYSEHLQEQSKILVYLPPEYTPFNDYPICIAQDGKDYFQLGRIARTLDELNNNFEIEPFIFFGIPYQSVPDRRRKYHPDGEKHQQYIQFLVNEFLPYVEENFPLQKTATARALAGDSLAATASLMATINRPDIFGKVILHSPLVDEQVLNHVEQFSNWELLNIYHVIGKQETEVKMTDGKIADFLSANRKLHERLKETKAKYFYEEIEGNHTWKYWQKDLRRAFVMFFS